jgi:drug/metabolite transporter (DMT)-like permease
MSKVIFAIGMALLFSVIIAVFQAVEGRGVDLVILTIHNLGFVFGTGAATIINVFNVLTEKREEFRTAKMPLVRFLFSFVWIGLILMLFVHTAEFLGEQNIVHWAKLIAVYAILAGASYIWFYLFPRVKKLAPHSGENPSLEFLSIQKQLKVLPALVLFFWYLDFFLNSFWPPGWHF